MNELFLHTKYVKTLMFLNFYSSRYFMTQTFFYEGTLHSFIKKMDEVIFANFLNYCHNEGKFYKNKRLKKLGGESG